MDRAATSIGAVLKQSLQVGAIRASGAVTLAAISRVPDAAASGVWLSWSAAVSVAW
jgi:hypothetical protein